jgi:hypothetical protein
MSEQVEGASAELASVIETADLIARDGLSPGSDGPRVLAGLISQLAAQTARLAETVRSKNGPDGESQTSLSPQDVDVPTEEDISPRDAPAEPAREI